MCFSSVFSQVNTAIKQLEDLCVSLHNGACGHNSTHNADTDEACVHTLTHVFAHTWKQSTQSAHTQSTHTQTHTQTHTDTQGQVWKAVTNLVCVCTQFLSRWATVCRHLLVCVRTHLLPQISADTQTTGEVCVFLQQVCQLMSVCAAQLSAHKQQTHQAHTQAHTQTQPNPIFAFLLIEIFNVVSVCACSHPTLQQYLLFELDDVSAHTHTNTHTVNTQTDIHTHTTSAAQLILLAISSIHRDDLMMMMMCAHTHSSSSSSNRDVCAYDRVLIAACRALWNLNVCAHTQPTHTQTHTRRRSQSFTAAQQASTTNTIIAFLLAHIQTHTQLAHTPSKSPTHTQLAHSHAHTQTHTPTVEEMLWGTLYVCIQSLSRKHRLQLLSCSNLKEILVDTLDAHTIEHTLFEAAHTSNTRTVNTHTVSTHAHRADTHIQSAVVRYVMCVCSCVYATHRTFTIDSYNTHSFGHTNNNSQTSTPSQSPRDKPTNTHTNAHSADDDSSMCLPSAEDIGVDVSVCAAVIEYLRIVAHKPLVVDVSVHTHTNTRNTHTVEMCVYAVNTLTNMLVMVAGFTHTQQANTQQTVVVDTFVNTVSECGACEICVGMLLLNTHTQPTSTQSHKQTHTQSQSQIDAVILAVMQLIANMTYFSPVLVNNLIKAGKCMCMCVWLVCICITFACVHRCLQSRSRCIECTHARCGNRRNQSAHILESECMHTIKHTRQRHARQRHTSKHIDTSRSGQQQILARRCRLHRSHFAMSVCTHPSHTHRPTHNQHTQQYHLAHCAVPVQTRGRICEQTHEPLRAVLEWSRFV
jgi:hypothetical protein